MPAHNSNIGWGEVDTERGEEWDLEVPSGYTCRVRALTDDDYLILDIVEDMDDLGQIIEKHNPINKAKARSRKPQDRNKTAAQISAEERKESIRQFREIAGNPQNRAKLLGVLDKIVMAAVLRPKLHVLAEGEEPKKGVSYVHKISLTDKMFIVQRVTDIDTSTAAQFPARSEEGVDAVDDEPGDGGAPE